MAKLTLTDGTIFEGTTEELIALTEQFSGKVADPVADSITHNGVEYTLVNRKAQVGDVVVFTENISPWITNGKVYGPVSDEEMIYDDVNDALTVYYKSLGRAESNTLVYEPKAEPLKVGDYAVVTDDYGDFIVKIGDICEIASDDGSYCPFKLKRISDGKFSGFMYADGLRKATDAEVAEAKVHAVFTQEGRKPNEYRKGDIIRITKYQNGDKVGKISEIITTFKNNVYLNSGYMADYGSFEPIVFAESRLDLRK